MCADNLPIQSRPAAVRRRGRILFSGAVGVVAALATAGSANAQANDYWSQPAGGSWDAASNWSLDAVPGNAVFNLPNASPFNVSTNTTENPSSLTVLNTSVTLNPAAGDSLYTAALNINSYAGNVSSLTFNGVFNLPTQSRIEVLGSSGNFCNLGGVLGRTSLTVNNADFYCEVAGGGPAAVNFATGSTVSISNSYIFTGPMNIAGSSTLQGSTVRGSGPFTVGSNGSSQAVLSLYTCNSQRDGIDIGGPGANGSLYLYGGTMTSPMGDTNIGSLGGSGLMALTFAGSYNPVGNVNIGGAGFGILDVVSGSHVNVDGTINLDANGVLTINSNRSSSCFNANLSAGSYTQITLGANASSGLSASQKISFGGSLELSFTSNFEPSVGQTFQLFSFNTSVGTFDSYDFPPLNPGLEWDTSQLYTTGAISVVAVPEPTLFGVLAVGAVGLLLPRRARTHQTNNNIH